MSIGFTLVGQRLAAVVVGVVFAAGVGELLARWTLGEPKAENLTPIAPLILTESDLPGVRFLPRPDAIVTQEFPSDPRSYFDPGARLTYRTNSRGFRNPEVQLEKHPSVRRILGIGDSFTFGTGVRREDTFLAVLEKRLNADSVDQRFEVINLGVVGYGTADEVALLRHVGIAFDPDVVVLCFFLNDTKSGPTHRMFNVAVRRGDLWWLGGHSVFFDRIAWALKRRRQVAELVHSYRNSFLPNAPGWMRAREALDEAIGISRKEEFDLVMMIFPVLWNLSDDYPFVEIHNTVKVFARSRGIPVLDLLPEFAGFRGPDLWVHPTNQHPNEKAHAIAGAALYRFWSERSDAAVRLVPGSYVK